MAESNGAGDVCFDVNIEIKIEDVEHEEQDLSRPKEFDESQGVSAPSKDEIFGKVNEITSHYQDINEKIIQQMKSRQEKQGSKLQDQLAARRQRRATKYVEEKQCLSLLE